MVPPSNRYQFLDLLKVFAILLMLFDHIFLYFYTFKDAFAPLAIIFFTLTSLSSALFIFITGVNLHLSFQRVNPPQSKLSWYKRKALTAFILIVLSAALYAYRASPNGHPLSTGVLQTIGFLWLTFGIIEISLPSKIKTAIYFWLLLAVPLLSEVFTFQGIDVPFLTSHSFPLFPHSAYFIAGLLTATFIRPQTLLHNSKLLALGILGSLSVLIASHLILRLNPLEIFFLRYTQHGYWQPALYLVLYTLVIIIFLYFATAALESWLTTTPFIRHLNLMGVYILDIYLIHLLIIYTIAKLTSAQFGFPVAIAVFTLASGASFFYAFLKHHHFDRLNIISLFSLSPSVVSDLRNGRLPLKALASWGIGSLRKLVKRRTGHA